MWQLDCEESWVLKNWCFWTVWSNQSILKEISPGFSLEGLMLSWNSNTLATSCKELTHWKRPWCWEGLGAGGEEDDRGWDGWMASPTRWTWVWVYSGSWWWTGRPGMLQIHGVTKSRTWLSDWTELNWGIGIMWNFLLTLCKKSWNACLTVIIMNRSKVYLSAWTSLPCSNTRYESGFWITLF